MATQISPSNSKRWIITIWALVFSGILARTTNGIDIFYDWVVSLDYTIKAASSPQPVITINGMFPGPLINVTTNDFVHVNVFNNVNEPILITWNGIQQRLNSWQDGVSGTNCAIEPMKNWTYVFQTKDQIGTFTYFPSINLHKIAGGYGPIRVNNRNVIAVPFPKPEAEFDLLISDWFNTNYQDIRLMMKTGFIRYDFVPDMMLMNGKGPYSGFPISVASYESFTVTKGKTYRFRISNVASVFSVNFRIQQHKMVLVETEGSYTNQITLDSIDVHVGQSYSVLVTADQDDADYYIVATPKFFNTNHTSPLVAKGLLHYANSTTTVTGPLPTGPDPFDIHFSVNQAKSIRWNLTTGAARPNPQGTFNVTNITLSQTFILHGSKTEINGMPRYVVNNVSYLTPNTPLKLADYFVNGSGIYQLDQFPVHSVNEDAAYGVSVINGVHKGWLEIVFKNDLDSMDSWHLDGFGFYVVGFGDGEWRPECRETYNVYDPVVRSTVQVYPHGWTAVYAYLDNPGMWNLRSQLLRNWFLGEQVYIRVHDDDPNPAKERQPPHNLLLCGIFRESSSPISSPIGSPAPEPSAMPPVAPEPVEPSPPISVAPVSPIPPSYPLPPLPSFPPESAVAAPPPSLPISFPPEPALAAPPPSLPIFPPPSFPIFFPPEPAVAAPPPSLPIFPPEPAVTTPPPSLPIFPPEPAVATPPPSFPIFFPPEPSVATPPPSFPIFFPPEPAVAAPPPSFPIFFPPEPAVAAPPPSLPIFPPEMAPMGSPPAPSVPGPGLPPSFAPGPLGGW